MGKIGKFLLALSCIALGAGIMMCTYSVILGLGTVGSLNGVEIKRAEIQDFIDLRIESITLEYMRDKIHIDALAELGITVSDEEIDKRVEEAASVHGGMEGLESTLGESGSNIDNFRYNTAKTLLSEKASEHFKNKQSITDEEIEAEFNRLVESGKEPILMDVTEIALRDDDDGTNTDIDSYDKKDIKTENSISTSVLFKDSVPVVGTTVTAMVNNARTWVRVDGVHRGIEDEAVRTKIENSLKETKGDSEYEKYIQDKNESATIFLR